MPHYKHPELKGDLYVVFDVEFPKDDWVKTVNEKVIPVASHLALQDLMLTHHPSAGVTIRPSAEEGRHHPAASGRGRRDI